MDNTVLYSSLKPGDKFRIHELSTETYTVSNVLDSFGDYEKISEAGVTSFGCQSGDRVIPVPSFKVGDKVRMKAGTSSLISSLAKNVWAPNRTVLEVTDTYPRFGSAKVRGKSSGSIELQVVYTSDLEHAPAHDFKPGDKVRIKRDVEDCKYGMMSDMEEARDKRQVLEVGEPSAYANAITIIVDSGHCPTGHYQIEPESLERVEDGEVTLNLTADQALTLLTVTRMTGGLPWVTRRAHIDAIGQQLRDGGVSDAEADRICANREITGTILYKSAPKPVDPWEAARCTYGDIQPGERFRHLRGHPGDSVKLAEIDEYGDNLWIDEDGDYRGVGRTSPSIAYRSSILREHGVA